MNDDFDAECSEVLARARRAFAPTSHEAARVSARLQRTLHADGVAVEAGPRRLTTTSALVGAGILAVVVASLQLAAPEPPPPAAVGVRAVATPSGPAPSPAPAAPEPPPVPEPARVDAPARSSKRVTVRRRQPEAPPAPAPSEFETLQAEIRALRRVERALRDSQPLEALAGLDELDRNVPQGKLGEERGAARIIARCALEPDSRAALLRSYAATHTGSMYLRRVEASCGPTGRARP